MGRVSGKVALVTGAASGIGRGAAEALAREGAHVVVTDINSDAGSAVAAQIGSAAVFMPHDVRLEDDWQRVMDDAVKRFGKLDILVNNAGITSTVSIEETSLAWWRTVMEVNLDGTFLGVKSGILAMKQTGGGSIINISSVGGIVGTIRISPYSASKAGVILLTKCAALECAAMGYNIRVNSICPGIIETPPCDAICKELGQGDVEAGKQYLIKMHPIGRMGHVSDVANGIIYLASDESNFVTGSSLIIDGGMTAD